MDFATKFCEDKCRQIVTMEMKIPNPITSVKVTTPDLKGDQFASLCKHASVYFEDHEPVHFFVKMELTQGKMKEMARDFNFFYKETHFLTDFVALMCEFCHKSGRKDLASKITEVFPKTYYTDEATVIMENAVPQGFKCLNKLEPHGFDIICMTLKTLATYHGISYCMIKPTGPKIFSQKYPYLQDAMFTTDAEIAGASTFFDETSKSVYAMLKKSTSPRTQQVLEKLKKLNYPNGYQIMKSVANSDFAFPVITHGDCWNNNMMFKIDSETKAPLHMKLVDLQMTRIASPTLDISTYLFTSANPSLRKEKLIELLQLYYDEFSETVHKLNTTLDVTFEKFLQDFRNNCRYGLVVGLMSCFAFHIMKDIDIHASKDALTDFCTAVDKFVKSESTETSKLASDVVDLAEEYFQISPV